MNENENKELMVVNPEINFEIVFKNKALQELEKIEYAKTFMTKNVDKDNLADFREQKAFLEAMEKDYKAIATNFNRPLNDALDRVKQVKDAYLGGNEKIKLVITNKIRDFTIAEKEKFDKEQAEIKEKLRLQIEAEKQAQETLARQKELEEIKKQQAQALFGDDEIVETKVEPAPVNVVEAENIVAERQADVVETVNRLNSQDDSVIKNLKTETVLKSYDLENLDLEKLRTFLTENALKVALNGALKRGIKVKGAEYEIVRMVK